MPWIQIRLNATADNAETLGDVLMEECGALSVTFLDAKDTPVLNRFRAKPDCGAKPTWLPCMMRKPI